MRTPVLAGLVAHLVVAAILVGCASGPSSTARASGTDVVSGSADPSVAPTQPAWRQEPSAPVGLTEVAAAAHDGRIWIAGGLRADGSATDAVTIFDPRAGTWSDGPPLPEPIHHAALASDGTWLWLLGGYVGGGFDAPTDAVRRLDSHKDGGLGTWVTAAPLPERRAAGAAAFDGNGRIVYAGGVGPGIVSELVFAGNAGGFEPIARLSEAREHLAAATDGQGRVWFLGGRQGGLTGNLARVDRLDGTSIAALDDVLTPRGGVAAFFVPALGPCLVGGESPDGTNPLVECIRDDGTMVALPDLAFPRHGLGAAVVDGAAYVLLGGPEPGLTVSATVESIALP